MQKVAIVGVGNVGAAVAYGIINQGLCNEVLLINRSKEKALGLALDLRQSMEYMGRNMHVWAGDANECGDADIVLFCLGGYPKADRNELIGGSCQMVRPFVEQIMASGFHGHIIVLTNPVDVITHYIYRLSGLPASHVIGTGTALDTARLKCYLSTLSGVDPRCITAYAMGEHGDSMFIPWSSAYISGKSLETMINDKPDIFQVTEKDLEYGSIYAHLLHKVKRAGWKISNLIGHTCYGVAAAAIGITSSILRDECNIVTCSAYLDGEYGFHDVFAGVPCIINANGVGDIIELDLREEEKAQFAHSIDVLKKGIALTYQDQPEA